MEATLRVLNDMERDGLFGRYAIAGAIALTFYTQPVETQDIDVLVVLPELPGGLLDVSAIYDHLTRLRGYQAIKEHVIVEGVPVRILPAYNALAEEALECARDVRFGTTRTRVLRVEHLMALMLQTGRAKDKIRLALVREQADWDDALLADILARHGLKTRWARFVRASRDE